MIKITIGFAHVGFDLEHTLYKVKHESSAKLMSHRSNTYSQRVTIVSVQLSNVDVHDLHFHKYNGQIETRQQVQ